MGTGVLDTAGIEGPGGRREFLGVKKWRVASGKGAQWEVRKKTRNRTHKGSWCGTQWLPLLGYFFWLNQPNPRRSWMVLMPGLGLVMPALEMCWKRTSALMLCLDWRK
jgi:hypothetical protein